MYNVPPPPKKKKIFSNLKILGWYFLNEMNRPEHSENGNLWTWLLLTFLLILTLTWTPALSITTWHFLGVVTLLFCSVNYSRNQGWHNRISKNFVNQLCAHTLNLPALAHDTALNFCMASLTLFRGVLWLWLLQLWRGKGKGVSGRRKPPVRKGLHADSESDSVEMGMDNREMVPMAFGSPRSATSGIQLLLKESIAVWVLHVSNPNLIFLIKASLYQMQNAYRLEVSGELVFKPCKHMPLLST